MKNQSPAWVNIYNLIESAKVATQNMIKKLKGNDGDNDVDVSKETSATQQTISDLYTIVTAQHKQIESMSGCLTNVMTILREHEKKLTHLKPQVQQVITYDILTKEFYPTVSFGNWKNFIAGYKEDLTEE